MKKIVKIPLIVLGTIVGLFVVLVVVGMLLPSSNNDTGAQIPSSPVIQIPNGDSTASNYQVAFEPIIEFHGDAYPVKILATATINAYWDGTPRMRKDGDYIGDVFGDFGVSLAVTGDSNQSIPVRIEVEGDRFIKKSIQEANVPINTEIEIFPRILYDYSALERLTQPTSANITFRIYINGFLVKEKVEVVRFHSVNEVPFLEISRFDNETIIDNSWLFAAYVNEDDPLIDTILKEALEAGTVDKLGLGNYFSFSGYQDIDGDDDTSLEVWLQVLAVWNVFQRHNIKYSNINATSTMSQNIASQYVRTLQETFGNIQANCVDGSVLFASVLRKLGIEPFLVIIPGHMFLGYSLDDKMENLEFLETTMLGSEEIGKYTKDDSLLGKLKNFTGLGKTQGSVSRDSFFAATAVGEQEFEEVREQLFDDSNTDYQIIDIAAYRAAGVMPIGRY
jgi:hypothetical protein